MDKNSRLEEKTLLNEANERVDAIVRCIIYDCERTASKCDLQNDWILERCLQKLSTEVNKIINEKR